MIKRDVIYFVSDIHLGSLIGDNRYKEVLFVKWLDSIKIDAKAIYILGDLFDFWYEYKHVVPKGFIRPLGKLAELSDSGVEIHFFKGNHDVWVGEYLEKELNLIIHDRDEALTIGGKEFYIGHGDGLNPKDRFYRALQATFRNRFAIWLFSKLHPDLALAFGLNWSVSSRKSHNPETSTFMGEEREDQVVFAKEYLKTNPEIDFFIFGHRHIMKDLQLSPKNDQNLHIDEKGVQSTKIIMLGDWITFYSFARYKDGNVSLEEFQATI